MSLRFVQKRPSTSLKKEDRLLKQLASVDDREREQLRLKIQTLYKLWNKRQLKDIVDELMFAMRKWEFPKIGDPNIVP